MLGPKPKQKTKLEEAIERVLSEMETLTPESEEYGTLLARLERLEALTPDKEARRVSPDTWAKGGFMFLNVLTMVAYEQHHVFTSKAMALLPRPQD